MEPIVSLFWISLCAVLAPLVAGHVPRRLLPEVVLLLVFGVVIGPHVLGLAETDEAIGMLRELGLGMLFLLAGYELEVEELTGRGGRRALVTWLVSFALAAVLVAVFGRFDPVHAEAAVAIALTSTALGTLLPILKDNGALGTTFGATVLNHGAFGELGPVVAMAILLGSRSTVASVLVLLAFAVLAALIAVPSTHLAGRASRLLEVIRAGSESTAQTTVRLALLLLVTLLALAAAFDLDAVLGAFAAGFILRRAVPSGDHQLEYKLNGLAFGFLIPVFFVTSGMSIDPREVAERPGALAVFVALILVARGVPVYVAGRTQRAADGSRAFGNRDSVRLALYGATGLPIIVAVTSAAVASDGMSAANASLLVAGGAMTVLVLPMAASLLGPRPAGEDPAADSPAAHRPEG